MNFMIQTCPAVAVGTSGALSDQHSIQQERVLSEYDEPDEEWNNKREKESWREIKMRWRITLIQMMMMAVIIISKIREKKRRLIRKMMKMKVAVAKKRKKSRHLKRARDRNGRLAAGECRHKLTYNVM